MVSLKTTNWTLDNVETVLFDKDGTLIDLHYFWGKMTEMRAQAVIARFNLKEDCFKTLCSYLGFDTERGKMLSSGITALYSRSKIIEIFKADLLELGVVTTEEELAKIFDEVSLDFYKSMQNQTKPIDSAIEFVRKLHSCGVRMGIVTSDSVESTKLTMKDFGWDDFFDCAIGRECSKFTKESGALTSIALTELDADPKKTVMVGDAPMDYWGAKNAGVENTILVSTGQLEVDELLQISPFVVASLNEVLVV